jgi:prophage regulatory protein
MTEKLLRIRAVKETTGLSKNTIYGLIRHGSFPRPLRIGVKAVGWREADVHSWIAGLQPAFPVEETVYNPSKGGDANEPS